MKLRISDQTILDNILKGATGPAAKARMGQYVISQAEKAFTEQRRGDVQWPPRGVPNIAGILTDLARGPNIKNRRFDPRPAGVDEGRLRKFSLGDNFAVTPKGFEIFSTVPYADRFQNGGASRIAITRQILNNLAIVMKRARGAINRARKKGVPEVDTTETNRFERNKTIADLGWIFGIAKKKGEIEVSIPPRPFLTIEKSDEAPLLKIAYQGAAKAAE